ncbi:MAG TPA: aspartyl protease family protein [Usitatibacter sp.]
MICKWLAACTLLAAIPAMAEDAPKCKLVRVADWHVRITSGQPFVDGSINGQKVRVLIDSGSYTSLVTKAAAERLGLSTRSTATFIEGVGGESRMLLARVDELKVEEFSAKGLRVLVGGEGQLRGIDLILGYDFLSAVDVEFDYAKGSVRLFQPLDCKGRRLAYWDADAQELPLKGSRQDLITVTVNGRDAVAQIDSGASHSIMHKEFSAKLGIGPETRGVAPSSCATGFGAAAVSEWVATYDSFGVGGETIRNAHIRMSEFFSDSYYYRASSAPDLLLGADFLKAHRVLIAHSQGKVYLSYTGGLVFPAVPALDCADDRVQGTTPTELIAAYDALIAKNPQDGKSLMHRGYLKAGQKDLPGALADFDAAVRIDPSDSVALMSRSRLRFALKDYDGALADSDAAIARGMRSADAYTYRAAMRRAKGDATGAMAEMDQALELDPHNVFALRLRGRALFHAGKFDAAENDFATVLAIRPNGFDSIWLNLARTRQGHDGREPLELGLAKLKDEWPAPVLAYLLDRIDRDALMVAAAANEKERKGRECEARFYTAERLLAAGKKDDARPYLEAAREGCPTEYIEYDGAITELERLR